MCRVTQTITFFPFALFHEKTNISVSPSLSLIVFFCMLLLLVCCYEKCDEFCIRQNSYIKFFKCPSLFNDVSIDALLAKQMVICLFSIDV